MAEVAADIQQHVDVVCLGAMEMQRESPDRDTVESILTTLITVRELAASAEAHPVIEAVGLVEEAVALALTEPSAPAPYLGHFVTSAAADLSRVVHAIAMGENPTPILRHARQTLTSMPRRGTDYLVQIDLNNPDEVARIFAAVGDATLPDPSVFESVSPPVVIEPATGTMQLGRMRELRQLLASYVAQTETLRSDPGRTVTVNELLVGAKALRASAAVAGLRPVERLAARLSYLFQSILGSGRPPEPDIIEFCVTCGRRIAEAVNSPDPQDQALQALDRLIEQANAKLKRFNLQTGKLQTGALTAEHLGLRAPKHRMGSNGHGEPHRPTIYEALQDLERQHGHETDGRPGPGRSRGDPDRFVKDIGDVSRQLPGIVMALERDRTSVSSRAALWDTLLKLKETSALAGASVILDQCWRIESTLTGLANEALTDGVLADLRGLDADLHWLISQVRPQTTAEERPNDQTDKLQISVEDFNQLTSHLDELLVRSGGQHHRSRRMGQAVQDISAAGDRLNALSRRLAENDESSPILGELKEIISDLSISAADLEHLRLEIDAASSRVGQVVEALSRSASGLQLTPVAALGSNLERAFRGLTHRLGKDASFTLEAGGMMVNSALHDRLNTVLLHLIRNAVDHGIEAPSARRAMGKPERGSVRLQARRDGTQLVIDVTDDGNGIDDRLVLRRAAESGYPVPPNGMTRERALQLIFLPGLTTHATRDGQVSKGHGLDVVGQLVAEMKGTVSIESELRRGTTVTIRLPLAITTSSAVVVSVSGEQFALPFVKTQIVPSSAVRSIEQEGTTFLADLGAVRVPILDLGAILGLRAAHHVRDAGGTVLRVEQLGSHWLIKVDEVAGVQEVELQPAMSPHSQLSGVVGSALLPSGAQAAVIDLDQLLDARRTARRRKGRYTATLSRVPFTLVADMSVTVRRNLTQVLEGAGWRVVEARDGLEAWELLESVSPELLVIDLDLPLLDPFQVIAGAKAHGDVPVIALAANIDQKTEAMAMASGVNALLHKPVSSDDLLSSLSALGGAYDDRD